MDVMSIANLSMHMNQSQLMSDISVAMLDKSLDLTADIASGLTDAIAEMPAISPEGVGQSIDILI